MYAGSYDDSSESLSSKSGHMSIFDLKKEGPEGPLTNNNKTIFQRLSKLL
jgi:hypothetical protein